MGLGAEMGRRDGVGWWLERGADLVWGEAGSGAAADGFAK